MFTRLSEIAEIYAQAFADAPWNEYTKCPNCQNYFGLQSKTGETCTTCQKGRLSLAYPEDKTVNYLKSELAKSKGKLITKNRFQVAGRIQGAGYGYAETAREFVATKYPIEQAEEITAQLKISRVNLDEQKFYISEVFVRPEDQNKGTGTWIVTKLLAYALTKNLGVLMRANEDSPMINIAKTSGMERILFNDPVNPKRVIFTK